MVMQGQELRALRKALGMSQEDLALAIGMSRKSISLMEGGHAPIEKRTELAVRYLLFVGGQREEGVQVT